MRCSGGSALLADARKHRAAIPGVFAVAGFLALWLGSVPYTVGGLFFAMRVASPTLALGAIVAGVVIARRPAPGLHPALLGLFLFATPPLTLL